MHELLIHLFLYSRYVIFPKVQRTPLEDALGTTGGAERQREKSQTCDIDAFDRPVGLRVWQSDKFILCIFATVVMICGCNC